MVFQGREPRLSRAQLVGICAAPVRDPAGTVDDAAPLAAGTAPVGMSAAAPMPAADAAPEAGMDGAVTAGRSNTLLPPEAGAVRTLNPK